MKKSWTSTQAILKLMLGCTGIFSLMWFAPAPSFSLYDTCMVLVTLHSSVLLLQKLTYNIGKHSSPFYRWNQKYRGDVMTCSRSHTKSVIDQRIELISAKFLASLQTLCHESSPMQHSVS